MEGRRRQRMCKYWEKNTIGDKVEKFRGECKKRSSRQCWSSQPVSGTWTPECQSPTFLAFLTAAVRVENMYESFFLDSGGKHVWELSPGSLWLSCSRALAPSLAQADESWRLLQQNSLLYLPGSQNSSQELLSQLGSLKLSRPLEGPECLCLTPCTSSYRSSTEGFSL